MQNMIFYMHETRKCFLFNFKIGESMKKKETEKTVKKDKKKVVKKESKKKESLFKQIKKEMSKVHFPSKKEMVKYSLATISFVLFFGIYFFVIELVMALIKTLI